MNDEQEEVEEEVVSMSDKFQYTLFIATLAFVITVSFMQAGQSATWADFTWLTALGMLALLGFAELYHDSLVSTNPNSEDSGGDGFC